MLDCVRRHAHRRANLNAVHVDLARGKLGRDDSLTLHEIPKG